MPSLLTGERVKRQRLSRTPDECDGGAVEPF